jgi:acetyl-CoA acetyltransferase
MNNWSRAVDPKSPILVSTARTPIGRFGGALRTKSAVELGAAAVAGAVKALDDFVPDHVYLGNVIQATVKTRHVLQRYELDYL